MAKHKSKGHKGYEGSARDRKEDAAGEAALAALATKKPPAKAPAPAPQQGFGLATPPGASDDGMGGMGGMGGGGGGGGF
jgi:hypothetical protein